MTWVTDSIFVAGGDYVREFWSDFQAQAGVSAVITVSADGPVAYFDPLPWAALWLPVGDEAAYRLDQLALGVRFIQDALAARRKLLLHGPKGVHRTRPLLAGHLLAEGKSLARALRSVEEKPWLPPYQGDIAVLEQLAARLAADRTSASAARKERAPHLDSVDRPARIELTSGDDDTDNRDRPARTERPSGDDGSDRPPRTDINVRADDDAG